MTGTLKAKVDGVWVPIAGSGGGTGSDEVWVGTDDPMAANPTVELWYDSDAPTPAAVDRWNSAWGIVAVGSFIGGASYAVPTGTDVRINSDIPFTSIPGRRYRMSLQLRVMTVTSGSGVNIIFHGSGLGASSDIWHSIATNYGYMNVSARFDGTGVASTYWAGMSSGVSITTYFDAISSVCIEDCGPISYGTPPAVDPTPTAVAWTPITPINGWVAPGSSEIQPGYRKVGDVVQLKGSIQAGASVALGQAAFILPAGYYNTVITRVSMVGFSPSGVSIPVRADLINTGSFIIQSMNNATINTSYLQLNGVSWPVGVT